MPTFMGGLMVCATEIRGLLPQYLTPPQQNAWGGGVE